MKTFRTSLTRTLIAAGFSGTLWAGLALTVSSLVMRASGGTIGPGTWLLITIGSVGGAAVGGWYTLPLLEWLLQTIRSRNPRNRR